jgi:hypothetical protein
MRYFMRNELHRSLRTLLLTSTLGVAVLAGCESTGAGGALRAGIPPQATLVREGEAQMSFSPQQAGRLYIYDASTDKTVDSFHLNAGQNFVADSGAARATIDGNEVDIGKMKKGHQYQIYFHPE